MPIPTASCPFSSLLVARPSFQGVNRARSKSGMQVPQPPELIHLIIPLILLPPPNAESLNELAKVENADPMAIMSVQFDPDGKTIVSGGASGTLKVWDSGTQPARSLA